MPNEFFIDAYTSVLNRLVREVVNDPSTYKGSQYLPSVSQPTRLIRSEIIEASGGVTQDYMPGTATKYVQKTSSRVQQFAPSFWKEALNYNEADILYLRELGQNDPSRRGIRQKIDTDIDMLNRRLEAKMELLRWQTIFQGGYDWLGHTVAFDIPTSNRAVPLGAQWSLDGINANNAANPILDYRYWVTGGLANFRKYKISKAIMNPNTARWFLDNTNVRSYVQNALANPHVLNYEMNQVINFFIPGAPPVEIYEGWYQNQSQNAAGGLDVTNAIYFIPDGYVFFEVTGLPGGDKIGEFVQTINLANGSVDAPGYGKFLVVEENIAPGTKGGPGNPYIDVFCGVYGSPNLYRPFDVLTGYVGPLPAPSF